MEPLLLPISAESLATAAVMVLGFVAIFFLGSVVLPGPKRHSYTPRTVETKDYKLTGLTFFAVTNVSVLVARFGFGISLTPIVQNFWSLLIVANVVAIAWALTLYWYGRHNAALNRTVGQESTSRSRIRDFWFGNELNPTWHGVDLKMFMYRPSLIGVYLIVLSLANAQYDRYGLVTPQMWLFVGFWFLYVLRYAAEEGNLLTMWDVTTENFGFMLVWGDFVYVPFWYALPGFWIVDEIAAFSSASLVAVAVLFLVSLTIFHQANRQKDRFKQDPNVKIWGKPAKTIGGKLLVSGWWGIGRKLNYTGDVGIYVSFALCAGISHWEPFLLPLSLFLLLANRASRDDKKCRAKYGSLWEEYCRVAKFRMIPYVY